MLSNKPLISVIIPAYNSASYLKYTLDSIFTQTYNNYEIIVIDDGSTDNTKQIIESYKKLKMIYIYQENSGGPSKPRNVGMRNANGELIAFFDSDDIMDQYKLEYSVNVFNSQPDVDFLFTDFKVINEEGVLIKERFLDEYTSFRKLLNKCSGTDNSYVLSGNLHHELIYANFIGTSSVVFKKDAYHLIGEMDEKLVCSEDRDYWYRLILSGSKFAFLDYPCHSYRKRSNSITTRAMYIFPSMIEVLKRQTKHVKSDVTLKLINEKLNEITSSYGWIATKSKKFDIAKKNYLYLMRNNNKFAGIKGYLIASVLSIIHSRN